jgi:hypothetical protein
MMEREGEEEMIRFLAAGWMDGEGWECERGSKMKGGRTQAAEDEGSPGKQMEMKQGVRRVKYIRVEGGRGKSIRFLKTSRGFCNGLAGEGKKKRTTRRREEEGKMDEQG